MWKISKLERKALIQDPSLTLKRGGLTIGTIDDFRASCNRPEKAFFIEGVYRRYLCVENTGVDRLNSHLCHHLYLAGYFEEDQTIDN